MWQPPADALAALTRRWSVTVGTPFAGPEVSAAWVAPVRRADGTRAVLKLGMPHMEARDEIAGLRFWNGDPTVRLLAWDDELNAMLLERCEPGTHLRTLPEGEQDVVIARSPPPALAIRRGVPAARRADRALGCGDARRRGALALRGAAVGAAARDDRALRESARPPGRAGPPLDLRARGRGAARRLARARARARTRARTAVTIRPCD